MNCSVGNLILFLSHLYAEVASVYVVSKEKVFGGCGRAPDLEQLHQVVELTVDVAANWKKKSEGEDILNTGQ